MDLVWGMSGWRSLSHNLVHCEQVTSAHWETKSGRMLKAKFLGSSWHHHRWCRCLGDRCTLPVADLLQPNLQPISGHTHSRDSV